MSLFYGYEEKEEDIKALKLAGGIMQGNIDMSSYLVKNVAGAIDDKDAINKWYFKYHSVRGDYTFRCPGITSLNTINKGSSITGNYLPGDHVIETEFTSDTKLKIKHISLDDDTTNFKNLTYKFHLEIFFKDKSTMRKVIGSAVMDTNENYVIPYSVGGKLTYFKLNLMFYFNTIVNPTDIALCQLLVEQTDGFIGGSEFLVHVEVDRI